jgi:hypothetical protein
MAPICGRGASLSLRAATKHSVSPPPDSKRLLAELAVLGNATATRTANVRGIIHSAGWRPATYYPDPAIHALDPRFEKYWLKLSAVERLTTGLRWAEGPVWFGDGRYLLCSDIPNNRILKWEEETGAVSIFRKPSNFANGHTRDRQGRLITCEHGGRRVTSHRI